MAQQSLIYSFVARGTMILSEYTEFTGNFTSIALQCFQKLPSTNNKSTYNCDGHTFNYLVDNGFTYCVVAIESAGQQLPMVFLERIKEDFTKMYGGYKAATANSLHKEFGPKQREQMQYCVDHQEEISNLAKAMAQVSEVKGVLMENIEKVLDRGEKIELLVDKIENLRSQVDLGDVQVTMEDKHYDDDSNSNDLKGLSHHLFGNSTHTDTNSDDDSFSITIIENIRKDEEYGMFVWPCSIVLAEYVWQQRSCFFGANVLELGAGTSLPGLVAAKLGSNVTLTDDLSRPEVLANMRKLSLLNNLKCEVVGLTWGLWDHPIFNLHPNIILGADVLYNTSAFDDLFATITFLLQNSPGSVFITTYHNRSGHHLIEFLMVKWGLKCAKLLDGFSFMPSSKTHALSGNIQLAEIILGGS